LTQAKDQADSVLIGQTKIDNEYVEWAFDSEPLGSFAIRRSFHIVSRFLKRASQETLDIDFVFNKQKAHEAILVHLCHHLQLSLASLARFLENCPNPR
jgi:hypothetical protein